MKVSRWLATFFLAAGMAAGAEPVSWEELPGKMGFTCSDYRTCRYELDHVNVKVTTRSAGEYRGRSLTIKEDGLVVAQGKRQQKVARQDVATVEVRPVAHHAHHITDGLSGPVRFAKWSCRDKGPYSTCPAVHGALALPFSWGFAAVSAPFALATDGVLLFEPTRVFSVTR